MASETIWPTGEISYRALDAFFFLSSTAILSIFLARRTVLSLSTLRKMSLARWLVLGLLADSLLFVWLAGILVLGIGTSPHEAACQAAVWWCITAYAISKIFIYLFLIERLYIVFSAHDPGEQSRWESTTYRTSTAFIILWAVVFALMCAGRIARFRQGDGACEIGLKLFSTVPMLVVDFLVNVYLTIAFIIPITRSRFRSSKALAIRSAIAAIAALATSAFNIALLTILHGKQLSWVCLASCGLDVTLNAAIIFWITSSDTNEPSLRRASVFSSSLHHQSSASQPSGSLRTISFLGNSKRASETPTYLGSRRPSLAPTNSSPFAQNYALSVPTLSREGAMSQSTLARPLPVAGRVSFSNDVSFGGGSSSKSSSALGVPSNPVEVLLESPSMKSDVDEEAEVEFGEMGAGYGRRRSSLSPSETGV